MFNSHKHQWNKWTTVELRETKATQVPSGQPAIMLDLFQQRECESCGKKEIEDIHRSNTY